MDSTQQSHILVIECLLKLLQLLVVLALLVEAESLPCLLLLVSLLGKLLGVLGSVFGIYLRLGILVCLLYLHGVLSVLLGEVEGCLVTPHSRRSWRRRKPTRS